MYSSVYMWITVPCKVLLFSFLHAEKSQNVPASHVSLHCKCHVLMCLVLIASTVGYFIYLGSDLSYFMYSLCVVNSCVSISVHRSGVCILRMLKANPHRASSGSVRFRVATAQGKQGIGSHFFQTGKTQGIWF